MIRFVLLDLLLDIFVSAMLVLTYHIIDRIALNILYGKGTAEFDKDYYIDRLVSIAVVGLIPVVNITCLCYMLWTFGDKVETFVWSIYKLARRKHGVIVRKEDKKSDKDSYSRWIFV